MFDLLITREDHQRREIRELVPPRRRQEFRRLIAYCRKVLRNNASGYLTCEGFHEWTIKALRRLLFPKGWDNIPVERDGKIIGLHLFPTKPRRCNAAPSICCA